MKYKKKIQVYSLSFRVEKGGKKRDEKEKCVMAWAGTLVRTYQREGRWKAARDNPH